MKKKLLSVILALCMVVGMLPITAFAATGSNYAITKAQATNGSFTVKVGQDEVTEAAENAEVIITPEASQGYEVASVKVTKDSDSSEITVDSTDGYKFTMPAEAVTVTVTFKTKAPTPEIKPENPTVTDGAATVAPTKEQMTAAIDAAKNDSAKTVTVSVEKAGTDLKSGTASIPKDSVSAAVNANVSYALDVAGVGGVKLSKEALEKVAEAIGSENSASVSVAKADTIADPEGVTIADDEEVSATFEAKVSVNGTEMDWTGADVTNGITLTFQIATGLTQSDISVYYVPDTGNAEEVTVTSYDDTTGLLTVTVDHLSTYSVVTPKVVAPEEFDITKTAATNGNFTVKVGTDEVTKAVEGAEVVITAEPAEGYKVDTVSVTKTAGGATVTVDASNGYKFTMPAEAVTVTVTFEAMTDVTLKALTITAGTLNFAKNTLVYPVTVANSVEKVTLAAEATLDTGVTVSYKIDGTDKAEADLTDIALTAGATTKVEITVTDDEDAENTKTYTISIKRAATTPSALTTSTSAVANVDGVVKVTIEGTAGYYYTVQVKGTTNYFSVQAKTDGKASFIVPDGTALMIFETSTELSFSANKGVLNWTNAYVDDTFSVGG